MVYHGYIMVQLHPGIPHIWYLSMVHYGILYHGILWYIMVSFIQMYHGTLWYTMVNHETVPWCTVAYYGVCDTNVPWCTMVNYDRLLIFYDIMFLFTYT